MYYLRFNPMIQHPLRKGFLDRLRNNHIGNRGSESTEIQRQVFIWHKARYWVKSITTLTFAQCNRQRIEIKWHPGGDSGLIGEQHQRQVEDELEMNLQAWKGSAEGGCRWLYTWKGFPEVVVGRIKGINWGSQTKRLSIGKEGGEK